jgi:hypothetical protein
MTILQALAGVGLVPLLLGGLFYALFSRLWFTYLPWSRNYHGAFSEEFIGPALKIRSAAIRFLAGVVMTGLVAVMANVLQLGSYAAFVKLGLFVGIGIIAVAIVQYASGSQQRRGEVLLETAFQIVAMTCIGVLLAWWQLK